MYWQNRIIHLDDHGYQKSSHLQHNSDKNKGTGVRYIIGWSMLGASIVLAAFQLDAEELGLHDFVSWGLFCASGIILLGPHADH